MIRGCSGNVFVTICLCIDCHVIDFILIHFLINFSQNFFVILSLKNTESFIAFTQRCHCYQSNSCKKRDCEDIPESLEVAPVFFFSDPIIIFVVQVTNLRVNIEKHKVHNLI